MNEVLRSVWMSVLRCESVSGGDDFFSMGGDSRKARQLFQEFNTAVGRDLPPVTIFRAPTFAEITALVDHGTQGVPLSHAVRMRSGDATRPIFIAPGLGNDILELLDFVNALSDPGSVYGFLPKYPDGKTNTLATVEEMADFYTEQLKLIQPRGPYRLIGYSFGGLVVFEIARRMVERGEQVDFLALIETYPYRAQLAFSQRLRIYFRLVKRHKAIVTRLPLKTKIQYLAQGSVRRRYTSVDDEGNPSKTERGSPVNEAEVFRKERETKALASYRPRNYPRKVYFVKATKPNSSFPSNPKEVWSRWCREIEEASVTGDHFEIVATYFQQLAAVMSRNLTKAWSEKHELRTGKGNQEGAAE